MISVTQAFTFEAAHRLPMVPDTHKCNRMHGHSYRVELTLTGRLQPNGFVVDFFDVETAFAPLMQQLDHHVLNDIVGLENPTAENIAMWIGCHLSLPLLTKVRVYETPMCWAEYEL